MLFMRGVEIIRDKSQVVFLLAEIVGVRVVAHPGQLQLEITAAVTEIDDFETAVACVLLPHGPESQRLVVKLQAALQVKDVKVEMIEGKHTVASHMDLLSLYPASGREVKMEECFKK